MATNVERRREGPSQGLSGVDIGGDYDEEERDFIIAMRVYMDRTGRRFPAFTEVLAVAKSLGYRRMVVGVVEVSQQLPTSYEYKNGRGF